MQVTRPREEQRAPRDDTMFAAAAYAGIAAVLLFVVWFSEGFFPHVEGSDLLWPFPGEPLFAGWVQFDAGWYRSIAEHGYSYIPGQQSSVAFFPGYPLLISGLMFFTGDFTLTAILVTMASGLGAALLFHRWCAQRLEQPDARAAIGVLLLYPYAWFLFGAIYADALFLLLVLGAFTLLERDQPIAAGIVAGLATATRPVGIAVVAGLILRQLERRGVLHPPEGAEPGRVATALGFTQGFPTRVDLRRLQPADAGLLLSVSGLVAYSTYLWIRFGDPFAFASVQEAPGWEQPAGPQTWFKVGFFEKLTSGTSFGLIVAAQAAVVLVALLLVPLVIRRFGWGYGSYTFLVVAMPALASATFQGTGRYVLAAFPAFAAMATLLAPRPRLRLAYFAGSAFVLIGLTHAFARSYYVS